MPILYIAGVSINNNPKDISPKTLAIIKNADIVIGEERKTTLRLLNAADANNKNYLLLNEHSTESDRQDALQAVMQNTTAIFCSDAGTPCISDPDFSFISMAKTNGIEVKSLPGPSSLTAALSVSGIDAKTFLFAGFPPREKIKRKNFFDNMAKSKITTVFMERPYALQQTLADMANITRKISLSLNLGCEDEKNFFDTPQNLINSASEYKAPFVVTVPPI